MTCDCNTTLCASHEQSFKDILNDIPDRLATMRVSITKQAVMGGQGGKPTNDDDRPLPVNLGAAEANHTLRAELVTFLVRVQHCLGERPHDRTMHGTTAWAVKLMPRIAKHPESLVWYTAISKAYERTTKAIDLPPERVRVGKCTCGVTLYSSESATTVKCKPCDITHEVADLRQAELNKIMDFTSNATMIIKALDHAGTKLKFKTLTSWADRGQVTYTDTADGRVFRVGDVLATIEDMSKVSA